MNQKFLKRIGILFLSVLLVAMLTQCQSEAPTAEEEEDTGQPAETTETEQEPEEGEAEEAPEGEAEMPEGDAASIAVEAAQQYSGTSITVMYEAGLQAQDGYAMGPIWEELTGISVEVIETPFEEMFSTPINEHLAGTATIDLYNVVPAWTGDFVSAGVLEPLDPYIEQYYPEEEMQGLHPTYLNNWGRVDGTWYGIPDDGDVHILYYRTDVFEDPENQAAFEEQYGYELTPPETWEQYNEICQFITENTDILGCAFQRVGQAYHWFFSAYRGLGGELFDPETMEAQVNNEIGVEAAEKLSASLEWGPDGQEEMGFIEVFSAFVSGDVAMAISWPPVGRWAQGVGTDVESLAFVPPTEIAGRIGYAPQPQGGELASGMTLGVSSDSENKEAAYLFAQWLNSRSRSLERVMKPDALRDPFRESHYTSEEYRGRWDNAGEYLDVLREAQAEGYLDLMIPGSREYQEAVERAITAIYSGADIQETLDQLAADWDQITEQQGVDSQREAYAEWAARENAYPNR